MQELRDLATYARSHILPAAFLSIFILLLIYIFKVQGISFRKWKQYLDKEVVIQNETVHQSFV